MYTFSNKLKTFSFILMILGALGVGYGFMTSHKSLDEVKTMLAEEATGHGGGHGEDASHAVSDSDHAQAEEAHEETSHGEETHAENAHHGDAHAEHVQHQLANRPWSALYVAAFFFMMIALGVLAFYAIQIASQAGWSPVLFRVMEGITAYLLPGALIVMAIAVGSHYLGHDSIFMWMNPDVINPESEHYDKLIDGKSSFLNLPWFIIRGLIFIAGFSRVNSLSHKIQQKIKVISKNHFVFRQDS